MGSVLSSDPALKAVLPMTRGFETCDQLAEIVADCRKQLESMQGWKAEADAIRNAINNPNDASINEACYEALKGNVRKISAWHEMSTKLGVAINAAATDCAVGADLKDSTSGVPESIAQLVALLFAMDQAKMMESGIQNDFAGYRRVVNKVDDKGAGIDVDDAKASMISMWVANPNPFAISVGNALTAQARTVLADLANSCAGMLGHHKTTDPAFCVEVIVGCMILYDNNSSGISVFSAKEVSVKRCIAAVVKYSDSESNRMKNALKYCTPHFNDASGSIQDSLE